MLIESKKIGEILIVCLTNSRLDAKVSTEFKDKMVEYIKAGNDKILLNLTGVDFVDSSGLGAIVTSLKVLGRNGDIIICSISDTVMPLFQLTRMDRVFKFAENEEEGLKLFGQLN